MVSISTLVDLVKIQVVSSGVGSFQLGPAVAGFRGTGALVDGATYSYSVQQGGQYEVGTGTYVASSGLLTRTPLFSSQSNAAVPFPANVELRFVALAQDIEGSGGGGGEPGPPGPPGPAGSPTRINVTTPAATWSLSNPLARVGVVQVFIGTGEIVIADVVVSPSQIVVTFPSPQAGFVLIF